MKRTSRYCIGAIVVAILLAWAEPARATLILNGSFESPVADGSEPAPDNWNFFTSGPNSSGVVSSQFAVAGGQVLQFFAPPSAGDVGSYQGYFQNQAISLAVSNKIVYSIYVRSSPFFPFETNATGKIGIEFRQGGSEVYREELVWTPSMLSTGAWTLFTISTYNTAAVDNLNFTIVQLNGATLPNSGIFWVDQASAYVVPEPSVLALVLAGGWTLHIVRRRRRQRRPAIP